MGSGGCFAAWPYSRLALRWRLPRPSFPSVGLHPFSRALRTWSLNRCCPRLDLRLEDAGGCSRRFGPMRWKSLPRKAKPTMSRACPPRCFATCFVRNTALARRSNPAPRGQDERSSRARQSCARQSIGLCRQTFSRSDWSLPQNPSAAMVPVVLDGGVSPARRDSHQAPSNTDKARRRAGNGPPSRLWSCGLVYGLLRRSGSHRAGVHEGGRTRSIAGNTEIRLKALWRTWAAGRASGNHQSALTAATRYELIADGTGDRASIILGARMLALTHHDLGNRNRARQLCGRRARPGAALWPPGPSTTSMSTTRVAMLTLLARLQWLEGFPDQADATAREAIDAALRMDRGFRFATSCFLLAVPFRSGLAISERPTSASRCFATGLGGIPNFPGLVSLPGFTRPLRGCDRTRPKVDALTAAYIEPRVQYPTVAALGKSDSAHSPIACAISR